MSNNKKTQKKQAKPRKVLYSIKERNEMSLKELEEHFNYCTTKQAKLYKEYKDWQSYSGYTAQILEIKKQLQVEEIRSKND